MLDIKKLINAKLNSQQKLQQNPQQKSSTIPTAKIKSVDRNPAEPKIKGNFEVRI